MKRWWQEFPFIRIIVPFVAGILVYRAYPQWSVLSLCSIFLFLFVLFWLYRKLPYAARYRQAFLGGIVLQCLLFFSGIWLCSLHDIRKAPLWYKDVPQYPFAVLELQEDVVEKAKTYKAEAEVLSLLDHRLNKPVVGKVLIYFRKSARAKHLMAGQRVLVRTRFRDLKPNTNPGGFDYRSYCLDRDIAQSVFVDEHAWKVIGKRSNRQAFSFYAMARSLRGMLARTVRDPSSIGIAEALLMGYRGNIDEDTWKAYSRVGIVHIIAISGMHMAMIYHSFRWLLLRISFFRKKSRWPVLLSLSGMWVFAALTGLPPSVGRAAWMFSFIGMGELFQRRISSLNNLLVSAFILLCIHPAWIVDIGFQLSYLAVLSLLLFYRPIVQLVYTRFSLADQLWQLLAATIAAQVLTFPLCIYYFKQFPLLFLFSNLFAVPATTAILYAEILLTGISWWPYPSALLGSLIAKAIRWLNNMVHAIDSLPFASLGNLQLNQIQVACCYGLLFFLAFWLIRKRKSAVTGVLCCIAVLLGSAVITEYYVQRRNEWIVYDAPKKRALEFHAGHCYFSPDETELQQDAKCRTFILEPAHGILSLNKREPAIVDRMSRGGVEWFRFRGQSILRLSLPSVRCVQPVRADYLVLSGEAWPVAMIRTRRLVVGKIILDATIPVWKAQKIRQALSELGIPLHCVAESGAFVKRF